jgi:hypothetical protein
LDLVMDLTDGVRRQFHSLREEDQGALAQELALLDATATAGFAAAGLDEDEQLAAHIRLAQFRCGMLAIHRQDATAENETCLALLRGPALGPVSEFMQARVGMVVLADLAVHDGHELPPELYSSFMQTVSALPERTDDEFWFFATLFAYKQGWRNVLAQAEEHLLAHWEDTSGQYVFKRTKLMRKLLAGQAKELDCGQVLQAINRKLFVDEFNQHLLIACDGAGLMTPVNQRIWIERQAEYGLRM